MNRDMENLHPLLKEFPYANPDSQISGDCAYVEIVYHELAHMMQFKFHNEDHRILLNNYGWKSSGPFSQGKPAAIRECEVFALQFLLYEIQNYTDILLTPKSISKILCYIETGIGWHRMSESEKIKVREYWRLETCSLMDKHRSNIQNLMDETFQFVVNNKHVFTE